jgi:mRNA-degrading endonuclease RelE of RelBE toxin-antitoxin system
MRSRTTTRFREAYAKLPPQVKRQAKEAFKQFQQNPFHPSLRFKQVHPTKPVFSARVSLDYRAVAVRKDEDIIWFWIGSHADYDKLISRL